ncbi:MAG: OsmC family protein [Planctomycetes bacterium]|nr:OsmC family protein [Planctomycetota bacterium]
MSHGPSTSDSSSDDQLGAIEPDRTFDGGDLDCGSGLVLLIREHMQQVPEGGVLEMRSVEGTVADDLPPWCRMVGHQYLGLLPGDKPGQRRFFVRRGTSDAASREAEKLEEDKQRAREYEWRVRARSSGHLKTSIYCRNFTWELGQPASFEEKDAHPSAVEALLGALGADLVTGFATACARAGLEVDDLELTARGRLHDVMAHVGLGEGDPAFSHIDVKLYASTFDDESRVRDVWAETLRRSPLAATLGKACTLDAKLAIV